MKNKKTIIIGLSIIVIMYGFFFGLQTFAIIFWRNAKSEHPELYVLPKQLQLSSNFQSAGTQLSYFGYKFEVPWTEIEKEEIKNSAAIVSFKSGKGIIFFKPGESVDFFEEFTKEMPGIIDRLILLFGKESIQSNYSFYQSILNATPEHLSVFMPRREAFKTFIRLVLKGMIVKSLEPSLYSFAHEKLRGFQFGNPNYAKKGVLIYAFDINDSEVEFSVFVTKDSDTSLSQVEVNTIIQTLKLMSGEKGVGLHNLKDAGL